MKIGLGLALSKPSEAAAEGDSPAPPAPPDFKALVVASGGATKTTSSFSTGDAASDRRLVVVVIGADATPDAVTVTPNSGSPVDLDLEGSLSSGFSGGFLYSGLVTTGTTCTVTVEYAEEPFNDPKVFVWGLEDDTLQSSTPVDFQAAIGTTTNVLTVDLATEADGFVIAASMKREFPEPTGSISGSGTFESQANATVSGSRAMAAYSAETPEDADFTCTATYSTSGTGVDSVLVVSSWR